MKKIIGFALAGMLMAAAGCGASDKKETTTPAGNMAPAADAAAMTDGGAAAPAPAPAQ